MKRVKIIILAILLQAKRNLNWGTLRLWKIRRCHLVCTTLSFVLFVSISCKRFIEVSTPNTNINSSNVFQDNATAAAVLTGLYASISNLANLNSLGNPSLETIFLYPGLSSDEITLYNLNNNNYYSYYTNNATASSPTYWNNLYSAIFIANSAIEGLSSSTKLTPTVNRQLLGEAKFIRALCYFYLTNLYGKVPLALTTDYKINSNLTQAPIDEVYNAIIGDLTIAEDLLSSDYLKQDAFTKYSAGTELRIRPTKWAAAALLARVFLYTGKYDKAISEATKVIDNTSLYKLSTLTSLVNTFKMNSSETIWALQPVGVSTNANTVEGALFILPTSGPNSTPNEVFLNNALINSFESGDQRKDLWTSFVSVGTTKYYYANKYKIGSVNTTTTEYSIVLRLSEQFLIRAESRLKSNDFAGSLNDLNVIRTRSGLSPISSNDMIFIQNSILHERQVELFTEWGHRWFDLKRTNFIDSVMNIVAPAKGGNWKSYKSQFPIPQNELKNNSNLIQNVGY